ncbi:MAG: hypothetical protein RL150_260 [Candidatus Parcubacteria bacterium]|jgi:hypothetical protein
MKEPLPDITLEVWRDKELMYHCRTHFNKIKQTQNPAPVPTIDQLLTLITSVINSTDSMIMPIPETAIDERFKPVDVQVINQREHPLESGDLEAVKECVLQSEANWFDESL